MDRRELFKRLIGGGAAIAAVPSATRASVFRPEPRNVSRNDFGVRRAQGDVSTFQMTLIRDPWPTPGQRLEFVYEQTRLIGEVVSVRMEPCGDGTWFRCHVGGVVLEFRGVGRE